MKKFKEFQRPSYYYIEKAIEDIKGQGYYENAEEIAKYIRIHWGVVFSIATIRDCIRVGNTVKNKGTISNGSCRCIYFHKSDTGKFKGEKA